MRLVLISCLFHTHSTSAWCLTEENAGDHGRATGRLGIRGDLRRSTIVEARDALLRQTRVCAREARETGAVCGGWTTKMREQDIAML